MIFIGTKEAFYEKYLQPQADINIKLTQQIKDLKAQLAQLEKEIADVYASDHYLTINIGDTVYDVVYRNKQGKFSSKSKASKKYAEIRPIEVTEQNIYYTQRRIKENEMFYTEEDALTFVNSLEE